MAARLLPLPPSANDRSFVSYSVAAAAAAADLANCLKLSTDTRDNCSAATSMQLFGKIYDVP